MIENAKQAHAVGKVWVEVVIKGGKVELNGKSVGTVSLKGPFTPQAALDIWKAAMAIEGRPGT